MTGKWTSLKNLGWAIGIAVCLLALVVGLVIASVNRYSGDSFSSSTRADVGERRRQRQRHGS